MIGKDHWTSFLLVCYAIGIFYDLVIVFYQSNILDPLESATCITLIPLYFKLFINLLLNNPLFILMHYNCLNYLH